MSRIRRLAVLTVVLSPILLLGGCPQPQPATPIIGSFAGSAFTRNTITVLGLPAEETENRDVAVTFGDDGRPTALTIFGIGFSSDVNVTVNRPGQTQTLTGSRQIGGAQRTSTYEVTVRSATLAQERITLVYDFDISISGSGFSQTGSGSVTFTLRLQDGALNYTQNQSTSLTQSAGGTTISVQTAVHSTGALPGT